MRVGTIAGLGLFLAGWIWAQSPPGKLTVEQAVAEALEKNLGLMAERANVPIAQARAITARLRPNPVLSTGGDHLPLLNTRFNEDNGAGPSEYNFRTDFVLERGGKRQYRIETAENARSVAELAVLNSARGVILGVQGAFVETLLAKESLELARENLKSLNQIVEINAARLKAGDIAEVELVRSRLAALQFETTVRQWELKVRTALTRLQTLLGRPRPSGSFDIAGELRRDRAMPEVEEIRKMAREARPDLRGLERDVARAESEVRLQLAQGRVDYTVGTEYRRQQGVNGKSNSLGFFLSVPLPVADRNQGEIERARQEERQARVRVRALESEIAGEVETACQQALTARELLESIENRMLGQARLVRDVTEYSYKRGEASLLEFLDAQRAFNETMQGHIEARGEYARSLYLLDGVSGKVVGR
ncbi:MAG: TolC family protein [Acidobacteria bacterium]|nr:TolC family protein [Acidobacteriota bacterium]